MFWVLGIFLDMGWYGFRATVRQKAKAQNGSIIS